MTMRLSKEWRIEQSDPVLVSLDTFNSLFISLFRYAVSSTEGS